jgi:ubiquinone/menaquinone biosynthesis C-methylase UbiE
VFEVAWLAPDAERIYSAIEESRHFTVFPWLLNEAKRRKPGTILDYGSGNGDFLVRLRSIFSKKLWYYDSSRSATRKFKKSAVTHDIKIFDTSKAIPANSVDLIISIAVWMTIPTAAGCIRYLRDQERILKDDGRSLVIVTHPCFREEAFSSFTTEFSNETYLRDGVPFRVELFDAKRRLAFIDYHWSLTTMIDQARRSGLQVIAITEFPDRPLSSAAGRPRGSPWLCFEFAKSSMK